MALPQEVPKPFDRRGIADAVFTFVLVTLGAFGFRTSFGGWLFLVVGLVAAAMGIGLAAAALRYRLTPLNTAALAVVVVVVAGGFAVPDSAPLGILPSPSTFSGLADGAANGWARLLTSSAPAGTSGNVLVVPYLCALAGAMLAFLLARRRGAVPWCLGPPVAVLVVSVLLGIKHPASLLLQGGAFAAVGIAWISARVELRRTQLTGSSGSGRAMAGLGMLSAVLLVATAIGPHLPGAPANPSHRVILRDDIVPPFDVRDYASPLVAYRKYLADGTKQQTLFHVTGLPDGALLRLAVMDDYDGIVWSVAPPVNAKSLASAGVFRHVGPSIPDRPTGNGVVDVHLTAEGIAGAPLPTEVWVPTVGAPSSIRFTGSQAKQLEDSFRFNRATNSAATPLGLLPGQGFDIKGVLDTTSTKAQPRTGSFGSGTGGLGPNTLPDPVVQPIRDAMAKVTGDDAAHAKALEQLFQKNGWYYDPNGAYKVPPGHSLAHLQSFLQNQVKGQPVGNEEQYAATMAVLARMLGMPARVVVGFVPQHVSDGVTDIRGDDARAWVEINFAHVGWVPYFPTPPRDRTTNDQPTPVLITQIKTQEAKTAVTTPPPHLVNLDKPRTDKGKPDAHHGGLGFLLRWLKTLGSLVALVALTLGGPMAAISVMKIVRRRRRRARGDPARRIAAGFAESLDVARDAGHPVPLRLTRVEAAQLIAEPGLVALAGQADLGIFGAADPTGAEADAFWREVDHHRAQELAGRTLVGKIVLTANPTSLVAGRPLGEPLVGVLRRIPRLARRKAAAA